MLRCDVTLNKPSFQVDPSNRTLTSAAEAPAASGQPEKPRRCCGDEELCVSQVHCLHHRSSFFCSDALILLAPYLLFASPSLPPLFFSPVLPREAAENIFPQTVKRVLLKGKD
ncbi:hypothetical protein AMECASPLE_011005 [Ameca splendens]|uniref:Uncharacterized protein n=1 Tax=Ameca splendens TaxID=208324 RepID=A0ABV0Z9Z9_9TELE